MVSQNQHILRGPWANEAFVTKSLVRSLPTTIATGLAIALIASGLLQLSGARSEVEETSATVAGTPLRIFRSANQSPAPRPVVVISHGFAGSQQLMRSYALSLARRGYLAITFDYYGHGRHPQALRGDITRIEGATQMLVGQTGDVVDYALTLPGTTGELALLGHSMASDIVVRYANQDPRVAATVTISMFSTAVSASQPKNLLVIVGDLEGFLKEEALKVLSMVTDAPREGVTVGNFRDGTARRIAFADGVEHVGVLYSEEALQEALHWLDGVFDRQSAGALAQRGPAIMMLLLGLTLLAWPLSRLLPQVVEPVCGASLSWRQLLPGALVPALGTPVLLAGFPADFMGALVGGYLAVHFLVYGLLGALVLWWLSGRRTDPSPRPVVNYPRLLIATILATLYVAGVFALVLDHTVTSYAITATRLPLVLATFVGTTAYFLADEWMAHGPRVARCAHLFTRLCFLLSLGIAVALSFEDLFFLLIIAAVIVVYFLIYGLFSRWIYSSTGHPFVGAIANAVSFAWALGAVFPFIAD